MAAEINSSLIELIKIIPNIKLDIRYATTNNFTGKVVYPSARCYLQEGAATALLKVQTELEQKKDAKHPNGLGLKVFDGYRPVSIQKKFWDICPDERYVANPIKGSRHSRGTAVDVSLVDLKSGIELPMPSDYDEFSEKAFLVYEKMPSAEIRQNCKLLESTMNKHGFISQPHEWWHYDLNGWQRYDVLDVDF
jgi:D-alanyl-D-alanine dipeptidase